MPKKQCRTTRHCSTSLSVSLVTSTLRRNRPNKAGLEMSVRMYVRTSVFDFNEIWLVCSGRWYAVWPDPRSRSRSRALESWKSGHFHKLSSPPFTMGAGNWPRILKLGHIIVLFWLYSYCLFFYHICLVIKDTQYLNLIGPDFGYSA